MGRTLLDTNTTGAEVPDARYLSAPCAVDGVA